MRGSPIIPSACGAEAVPRLGARRKIDDAGSVLPAYLEKTYRWAYLRPLSLALLDHNPVVSAILWGQANRLVRAAAVELCPGQRVLQPACVYGDFSARIAALLGREGWLDVSDIAPIQVENCRRKLAGFTNCRVTRHDASAPMARPYDVVLCFFLLHELPSRWKRRVVQALVAAVAPGGKAVFVDYHRPHALHPLRWPMRAIFALLEPFAAELWRCELRELVDERLARRFAWTKITYFGGLYQKVVAHRIDAPRGAGTLPGRP